MDKGLPDDLSAQVPRSHVKAACDYMLARLEDPLTLGDIAQAVCVSTRTLQRSFQLIEGRGPLQWLRERRLHAVREALLCADVETARVADTAMRFGFNHLGDFSRQYRRTYGETASETLARRS